MLDWTCEHNQFLCIKEQHMTQIIKLLTVVALICSIAWLVSAPGFEPAIALVGSMSALVSTFVVEKRSKQRARQQHQSVSKSSMGIQAGGDVSIGDINSDKHAK
jgi:allophanate hydrolase subunit 1